MENFKDYIKKSGGILKEDHDKNFEEIFGRFRGKAVDGTDGDGVDGLDGKKSDNAVDNDLIHARKILQQELNALREKYEREALNQRNIRYQRIFNRVAFMLRRLSI